MLIRSTEGEQSMEHYSHTQRVPTGVVVAVGAFSGLVALAVPGKLFKGLAALGLGGLTYTFSSMTVTITDEHVEVRFGEWLPVKYIALSEIAAYQPARMTPFSGWGIHFIGAGWLYNVYGLDAIEITLTNGEKVFIGTDEPEALRDGIASARVPVA